jgi:hypothetical protein
MGWRTMERNRAVVKEHLTQPRQEEGALFRDGALLRR